jgi:hypothetical protein
VVLGDGQRIRVSLLLLELTFPWLAGHVPPPRLLLLPDMNAEEFNRTLGLFLGEHSASSTMEEANIDDSGYSYLVITLCCVHLLQKLFFFQTSVGGPQFLGLSDPDPLGRGPDPDPSRFS